MQTLWKLSQDGNSASRTLDNGSVESRLVVAIPADELATALPYVEPLADAQSAQVAILQAAYHSVVNAPVTFKNAAGVTSTYPSGDTMSLNGKTAAQNLSDALTAGAAAWSLGNWIDTAGVAQVFSYADLQGLAGAMETVTGTAFLALETKAAQVQAAATVAAVQLIV
jgi:hypothetical protein